MTRMKRTPLSQLASVSAGQGAPKDNEFSENGVPFVRAGSLESLIAGKNESELELVSAETAKLRKLKTYPKGTILFAKSGMSATKDRIYVLQNPAHVVSHLATLIPKDGTHVDYLRLALKRFPPSSLIKDPAYPAIGLGEIEDFEISVPEDFNDQIRIAHLLGKAEGLIAQRKQHLQQLDDLLKSVFLEMFGDPVRNEKRHKISTLAPYITHLTSGGRGWADYYSSSGKRFIRSLDVQMNSIGSEDIAYVTPPNNKEAERTRVLPGDVLLTITGSKIGRVCFVPKDFEESYISQHVAIIRTEGIDPIYLSFYLSMPACGQRAIARHQYGQAKPGLNLTQIQNFEIVNPKRELQEQFAAVFEKIKGIKSRYQQSLTDLEALYGSLSQQAFKGELNLSRVALPAAPIEGESPVAAAVPVPITTPVVELPETDLLPPALQDRTQLAPLLRFWLEAYRTQLGSAAFSLERFIAAAQTRLTELHPDHDFALNASDYEAIKAWVFDEIRNRKLKQTRDIIGIDGRRQFGNQISLRARRHAQQ